jgi:hypothetical protein
MKRHELEHLIRAAGAITGAEEVIVIGSRREKDVEFITDMVRHRMIDGETLLEHMNLMPVDEIERALMLERWQRVRKKAGHPSRK